jgi:hypothetical protein
MGEQVAFNKTPHYVSEVFENDNGDYYVVIDRDNHMKLIRGEYVPIGNRFLFPTHWGRTKGAVTLLDHLIENDEILFKQVEERLHKLKKCRDTVITEWDDAILNKKYEI